MNESMLPLDPFPADQMAAFLRITFDALVAQGFNDDQALALTIATVNSLTR